MVTFLGVVGLLCLQVAAYMVAIPLGVTVGGVECLLLAYAYERRAQS